MSSVITLGKKHRLLASISMPGGWSQSESGEAVVVLGMGMAEVRIARRLKALGQLVMQIRLIDDKDIFNDTQKQRAIYDQTGVERIQEAMDYLWEHHRIERFYLMGNCAGANMSINTAIQDSRVIGVIPVNMRINEILTQNVVFKQKLANPRRWQKFFKKLFSKHRNTKPLRQFLLAKLKRSSVDDMIEQWDWHKDLVVPIDLDRQLVALTQRGVKILMVFAYSEDSLVFLQQKYGDTLKKLAEAGCFQLKVIGRSTHVFSHDEISATMLNNVVSDWFEQSVIQRDQQVLS